jgi:hypothetical protein
MDEDNSTKADYAFVGKDEDWSKWVESETFFREGAQAFLKSIEDSIDTALSEANNEFLDSEDKKFLDNAKEELPSCFDEIVKCFVIPSSIGNQSLEEYRYEALWSFMSAIFVAGSRGVVSNSVRNYLRPIIEREKQDRQAGLARAGKNLTDVARNAELLKAIRDELGPAQFSVSEKFASQIRPAVLRRLNIAEEKEGSRWPSVSKIKVALGEIKKGNSYSPALEPYRPGEKLA